MLIDVQLIGSEALHNTTKAYKAETMDAHRVEIDTTSSDQSEAQSLALDVDLNAKFFIRANGFCLLKKLGQGSFGKVRASTQPELTQSLCVRIIDLHHVRAKLYLCLPPGLQL